jgi:hypothetical protein
LTAEEAWSSWFIVIVTAIGLEPIAVAASSPQGNIERSEGWYDELTGGWLKF